MVPSPARKRARQHRQRLPDSHSHRLRQTVLHRHLAGIFPFELSRSHQSDDYEEDTSPEFINSLYKTAERPDWSDTSYYASPERIGTVRTDLLEWYSPERTLDEMKLWATTGIRPNNIKGLMSDAAKWLDYYDMNRPTRGRSTSSGNCRKTACMSIA